MTSYDIPLAARREAVAASLRTDTLIARARLAVFLVFVVAVWFSLVNPVLPAWLSLVPLGAFAVLVVRHQRVIDARRRQEHAVRFYELAVAKVLDSWAGKGEAGADFLDEHHPYAADLDLFGRGSLFDLLWFPRTRRGDERLAAWLNRGSDAEAIRARQGAVGELCHRVDLREDLAVVASDVRRELDSKSLTSWSNGAPSRRPPGSRTVALVLSIIGAVTLLAALPSIFMMLAAAADPAVAGEQFRSWGILRFAYIPFVIVIAIEGLFAMRLRGATRAAVSVLDRADRELMLFASVLERLERERFASETLVRLRGVFETDGSPASREIAHLHRLVVLLDSRNNMFFKPFAAVLLWDTQIAMALDRWRARVGVHAESWLDAAAEIEALSAFAHLAHDRPAAVFPTIASDRLVYDAKNLGHPLIPPGSCVRNSARLDDATRVMIVSGSNMSGKSTMLRTVGTNAVLALAGAPVIAESMTISPLAIGASIRISDSLQEGSSRFYSEIRRLKQIVEISTRERLLFLLDEILHGTNSHDRRIGAEGVIRSLVGHGAVGLVTTHDLALARLGDSAELYARNVHFADRLEGDRIVFDYTMREGVVQHSNALQLMRMVGLEV